MKISRKKSVPTVPWKKWKHPYFWVASSLGLGLTSLRGPAGALLALVIVGLLQQTYFGQHIDLMLALTAALFLLGVKAGDWWEAETKVKDTSPVTIDETVGMMLALVFLPGFRPESWLASTVFFFAYWLIFILFDYFKPWPCKGLENKPGGWGVMLDDIGAGVYTIITSWLLLFLLPYFILVH